MEEKRLYLLNLIFVQKDLESNPWIVQPFEHYEEIKVEDLIKKHQKN